MTGSAINTFLCNNISDSLNNKGDITNCVDNITKFVNGKLTDAPTLDNDNIFLGANYITNITTLIEGEEKHFNNFNNDIATFKESVNQQVNPETTINARSQRTGIFAPPRPLKPLSVSILLGLSFTFFFITLGVVYKTASLSFPSTGASTLTFNTVKNIAIGLLLVVILVLGLKLGNVI